MADMITLREETYINFNSGTLPPYLPNDSYSDHKPREGKTDVPPHAYQTGLQFHSTREIHHPV